MLSAQGKLQEALEVYQQSLKIGKPSPSKIKPTPAGSGNLIVSLYKVAMTTAKIGGDDEGFEHGTFTREALNLTDKYPGMDRQQLIDGPNQALQQLVH